MAGVISGCSACKRVFSGVGLFDAHRGHHDPREEEIGKCQDPVNMGLVQREDGVWFTPAGLAQAEAFRQMALKKGVSTTEKPENGLG
jgi:hypothetical protein